MLGLGLGLGLGGGGVGGGGCWLSVMYTNPPRWYMHIQQSSATGQAYRYELTRTR